MVMVIQYDVPSSLPFPSLPFLPFLPFAEIQLERQRMGGATFTSVPSTPVTSGIQTFLVKIFHLPLEVIVLIVPILTFLVRAW
jgi:hypothetical protein